MKNRGKKWYKIEYWPICQRFSTTMKKQIRNATKTEKIKYKYYLQQQPSSLRSTECSADVVKGIGKIPPRAGVNKSQWESVCSAETQSETRQKSNLADVVPAWRKPLLQIDRKPGAALVSDVLLGYLFGGTYTDVILFTCWRCLFLPHTTEEQSTIRLQYD